MSGENARDPEKTALADEANKDSVFDDGPEFDSSKVKFINGGADAVLDIDEKKPRDEFLGLTKEELKKYAKDPYWVRVRWALFILFWVIWVGMLAAAVIIIVVAPRCPHKPKLDWHQTDAMYQVNTKAFKDSNSDGTGDFNGILEKLGYLEENNVKALLVEALVENDYGKFDTKLGTEEDLSHLISTMHKKDMKLILEMPKADVVTDAALEHWLGKGVNGFRVIVSSTDNATQVLVKGWRSILDDYSSRTSRKRILIVQGKDKTVTGLEKLRTPGGEPGAHMIVDQTMVGLKPPIENILDRFGNLTDNIPYLWMVSKDGHARFAHNLPEGLFRAATMLYLTLPGTPLVYYGDEIGMQGQNIKDSAMQWSNKDNAGFTDGTPNPDVEIDSGYVNLNVQQQLAHGMGTTNLEVFRDLTKLRTENSFLWGEYEPISFPDTQLTAYTRRADGFQGYLVAMNFESEKAVTGEFHAASDGRVPKEAIIVATTGNFTGNGRAQEFKVGTTVKMDNVYMKAGEGIVFRWEHADSPV